MKRKKGRATSVQSPAVNAALLTLRGGGPAYRGRGGIFGGGCVSAVPPWPPGMRREQREPSWESEMGRARVCCLQA